MQRSFTQIFGQPKPIIGMIHLAALPGTPAYAGDVPQVIAQARAEAETLVSLGIDAILIENMHDTPYLRRQLGPEITAMMTIAAQAIKEVAEDLPCGVQVLAGANQEALAVAQAAQLDFIRAEGFVFGHLADEGWMNSDAATLLRYRKQIGADEIAIWTDIKKKHSSHALSADISLAETAKAAAFFRTDGLIVTGVATGAQTSVADLETVREACPDLPLVIGSGITADNLSVYLPLADAFIVGSYIKKEGHWANPLSSERIRALLAVRDKNLDVLKS